jgi:DNA-directed RNA polymerase III subunit RPC5
MELLKDNTLTADKVLRTLPSAGVLINGNWTVQSEIIYPKDSVSGTNGIVAEVMARARDYVLFQFTKQEFLSRQKIAIYTQLPIEEVKEILMSVARLKTDKGWELLLPSDSSFEKKFPEIVQRQEMYWKAKEERFAEMEEDRAKRVRKRSVRDIKSETK